MHATPKGRRGRGGGPGVPAALAVTGALALSACGFRLAGAGGHLPPTLARPYLSVKDPYTDFAREFERELKSSGAELEPGRQDATATIEVTKDVVEQRTLAVSARNIPTDYELTYTVTFAVHGPDAEIMAPQTITLSKDYSFEENVLLAKEHEADILRAQMARDLVAIAMHRLTRLK
jgi:outer membrane lipopolysaccharide assembly protein LptE/RlpB